VVLATAALSCAKTVTPTLNIGKDTDWRYMTKFHFSVGTGSFAFKAKVSKPLEPNNPTMLFKLAVYLHDPWVSIIDQTSCHAKLSEASLVQDVSIPGNGEWSDVFTGMLTQSTSDRVWYFALADCDRVSSTEKKRTRLRVDLQILNSDGSQFSLEDESQVKDHLILASMIIIVFLSNFWGFIQKWKSGESIETVQVMLILSILTSCMAELLKVAHVYVYSLDGSGLLVLDFFAESFEVLSSIILTVIFILISSGWLLQYHEFPEPETYIPVAVLIFIVNVLIVGIGRISDDDWYKVTDYQGLPGFMIVFIRIAMWAWFYYNVGNVLTVRKHSEKLFVSKFTLYVSAYFWSLVVVIFLSWGVAPLSRQRFVVFCMWLVQLSGISMTSALFNKKSQFYRISALSASELPGNLTSY